MKTKSTWGKAGDVMRLEIDPKSHPVWTGIYRMVDTGGQLSKFKNKFGAFGLKPVMTPQTNIRLFSCLLTCIC